MDGSTGEVLASGAGGGARKPVDRRRRFEEVAAKRTQAIVERLRLLARCGDSRSYDYSDAQVGEMFKVLELELETTRAAFESGGFRFSAA